MSRQMLVMSRPWPRSSHHRNRPGECVSGRGRGPSLAKVVIVGGKSGTRTNSRFARPPAATHFRVRSVAGVSRADFCLGGKCGSLKHGSTGCGAAW